MQNNILVEVLGETPNIKLIGFFLENPFDAYNISQINNFTGVAKDTIKKYLKHYEKRDMVCCVGEGRIRFQINIHNPYVRRLEKIMFDYVDIDVKPDGEHIIIGEGRRPYGNFVAQNVTYRVPIAGA